MKTSDKAKVAFQIIEMTPKDAGKVPLCGHKDPSKEAYRHKFQWIKKRMSEGLKVKMLNTPDEGIVGYIEYVPGEYALRAVNSENYMFIHCIYIQQKRCKGGWYGRRGKRRTVPLTASVRKLLELHFCTNNSIGFSKRTAQRVVKRVANRAMITKPVTPHVLRHTFAVNCVKKGVSTASLKKILGHNRLETTEIYLNIFPEDALNEFFQKVDSRRRQRWD